MDTASEVSYSANSWVSFDLEMNLSSWYRIASKQHEISMKMISVNAASLEVSAY